MWVRNYIEMGEGWGGLSLWGGGGLELRTAIEGSFSAWGCLGNPNRGRGCGETFFPDSGSDRNSDETFQISRNLGLEHVEFFCLLDSQPCCQVLTSSMLWSVIRSSSVLPVQEMVEGVEVDGEALPAQHLSTSARSPI